MTESQLRAKIEYCVKLRGKYERMGLYFDSRIQEYREDLNRMHKISGYDPLYDESFYHFH